MKNHFLKITTLLVLTVQISFAQLTSIKNEFREINAHYLGLSKVSMNLSFKVFVEGAKDPSDVSMGYYRIYNGKTAMKYFGMEMMVSNSKSLMIHEESRTIYLDTIRGTPEPKSLPDALLDSLFLMYKDVTTSQETQDIKKYQFFYEGGEYSKIEVYVNNDSKFITKIVSYPVSKFEISEGLYKNVRAEIEFSRINTNPTFANELEFSRVLNKVSGVYQLTPQYSTYTLINLL